MIDYVCGTIKNISEKSVVINVYGMGINLNVPQPYALTLNQEATLHTYLHWSQDNGPTLYGFVNLLERTAFLLLLECHKIGPGIALNILSQITPTQLIEIVSTQNERKLSSLNGIGPKKAEQIILELKHKVQKLVIEGAIASETQENFVHWQNVSDVLGSLNYSKTEISKAMSYLAGKYRHENCSLDQLIRSALSFLSTTQSP